MIDNYFYYSVIGYGRFYSDNPSAKERLEQGSGKICNGPWRYLILLFAYANPIIPPIFARSHRTPPSKIDGGNDGEWGAMEGGWKAVPIIRPIFDGGGCEGGSIVITAKMKKFSIFF